MGTETKIEETCAGIFGNFPKGSRQHSGEGKICKNDPARTGGVGGENIRHTLPLGVGEVLRLVGDFGAIDKRGGQAHG